MAKIDVINEVKTILAQDNDFLKPLLTKIIHEVLEIEMNETIGAVQ